MAKYKDRVYHPGFKEPKPRKWGDICKSLGLNVSKPTNQADLSEPLPPLPQKPKQPKNVYPPLRNGTGAYGRKQVIVFKGRAMRAFDANTGERLPEHDMHK